MYGVQNHRSYSTGVNVLGSRFAKASSGLVSALTYSLRYCPGWLASCCATRRGTITASSSSPPLSRIPTALRNSGGAEAQHRFHWEFQDRCKAHDIVVPEDGLKLRKVGFREIRAGIDGTIVHAADFERQRISLRRDQQICTQAAEFLR